MKIKITISAWKKLFFLSLLFSSLVKGQNYNPGSFIPPAPDAAAIGKFGGISPNLSSGGVNLSVPIYEFKSRNIKLPVSLAYASTGFKVDEIASRVGTGWSLNAGGVVTRNVHGAVDEYTTQMLPTISEFGLYSNRQVLDFVNNITGASWDGSPKAGPNSPADGMPDIFNFNFNGYSGRFILKFTIVNNSRQCEPVLLTHSGIKIETGLGANPYPGYAFKITTPDGVQYYFNDGDYTSNSQVAQGQCPGENYFGIATAWYLTRILHPNGDEVNLHYDHFIFSYITGTTQTIYKFNPLTRPVCFADDNFSIPVLANSSCTNRLETNGSLLTEISSTTGGKLKFNYINRIDNNDKLLNSIEVYQPGAGSPMSVYELNYQNASARPFLMSLVEKNGTNVQEKRHAFAYNSLDQVPQHLSFTQDHWGYYNGKFNSTLIPVPSEEYFRHYLPEATANREADANYGKIGLLSSITYPTGGVESITYEGNEVFTRVTIPPTDEALSASANGTEWPSAVYSDVATLSFDQFVDVSVSYQPDPLWDDQQGWCAIINTATNQPVWGQILVGAQSLNTTVYLLPGTYKIELTFYASGGVDGHLWGYVGYKGGTTTYQDKHVNVGGVRVASISLQDPVKDITQIRKFNYNRFSDPGKSSGVEGMTPSYMHMHNLFLPCVDPHGAGNCPTFLKAQYFSMYSNSIYSVYDNSGDAVSYENITESFGDNAENGIIYHEFQLGQIDGVGGAAYGDYIIGTPAIRDYQWDKEIYTGVYKKAGTGFLPVKKTYTHYVEDPRISRTIIGYMANKRYEACYSGSGQPSNEEMNSFDLCLYNIYCKWVYPDIVTEQDYDASGQTYLEKITTTEYANTEHTLPTKVKASNSKQEEISTTYAYPANFSTTAPYDEMLRRHIINPVVEQSNYRNNQFLQSTRTNYVMWGNGTINPASVESKQTGQTNYDTRLRYHSYDNFGNVTSLSAADGPKISYQYGYGNQYPIAECKNALNTEFYYQGFEDASGTGIITGAAHTGNNYTTNANVSWQAPNNRAYVISYWYKTGGVWKFSGVVNYNGSSHAMQAANGYDDIRIYPANAQMTSYTYNPLVGMTSATDARDQVTYYEYDSFGRLQRIRDQENNILKTFDYKYQADTNQ